MRHANQLGGPGEDAHSSGVILLDHGLSAIDEKSWVGRNREALRLTTRAFEDPTLEPMVHELIIGESKAIGNAEHRFSKRQLLEAGTDPVKLAKARRRILGINTLGVVLVEADNPEVKKALRSIGPYSIQDYLGYAIEQLDRKEAERDQVLGPIRHEQPLRGPSLGLTAIWSEAVDLIRKTRKPASQGGVQELAASLHKNNQEIDKSRKEEGQDFAYGYSALLIAMAKVIAESKDRPSPAAGSGFANERVFYYDASDFFTGSPTEPAAEKPDPKKPAVPTALHDMVKTGNYEEYGISMKTAFDSVTNRRQDAVAELNKQELPVIDQIRRAVNDTPLARYGTPNEGYGITAGSDMVAVGLGMANPELRDVLRSLDLVSPTKIDESITTGLDKARALAEAIKDGKMSLTVASEMLYLKPKPAPAEWDRHKEIPPEDLGVPLLHGICMGLDRSAGRTEGESLKIRTEKMNATYAGGFMYLAIVAELLKRIPQPAR